MKIEHIQHAVDLLATSNPKDLKGNENSINAAKNLLTVIGEFDKFVISLNERGIESTDSLFEAFDSLNPQKKEDKD